MFIWLLSLSLIPVLQFYRVVNLQEEEIWRRAQMNQMAVENLSLAHELQNDTASWVGRIQGNGIDGMVITYPQNSGGLGDNCASNDSLPTAADRIYGLLSDPITEEDGLMAYLKDRSFHCEWRMIDGEKKLVYSLPGADGFVSVQMKTEPSVWASWLVFIIPAIIILLLVWFVLGYVNEYIFYTKQYKWKKIESKNLDELIKDESLRRILVNSFNERKLEQLAIEKIRNLRSNTSGTGQEKSLVLLPANELLNNDFRPGDIIKDKHAIFWISGIELSLFKIDKQEQLLSRLLDLIQKAAGKVIVVIPFEVEYIHEYFEDYIRENKVEDDAKTQIFRLKRSWEIVLKEFDRYYIPELDRDQMKNEIEQHSRKKLFYLHIWSNLCRNEKLVLYDLAEDGLINLKNKKMINQLLNKDLIVSGQYLKIYSSGFEYFINNTVGTGEKKALERSMSLTGMWHNLRFPIVIVLVILAAFIFISQGYSIEKVTAIFAGILTLMATMVRMFNKT